MQFKSPSYLLFIIMALIYFICGFALGFYKGYYAGQKDLFYINCPVDK
jgi:hypothetical protein